MVSRPYLTDVTRTAFSNTTGNCSSVVTRPSFVISRLSFATRPIMRPSTSEPLHVPVTNEPVTIVPAINEPVTNVPVANEPSIAPVANEPTTIVPVANEPTTTIVPVTNELSIIPITSDATNLPMTTNLFESIPINSYQGNFQTNSGNTIPIINEVIILCLILINY